MAKRVPRRYLVSMPCPAVGVDIWYHSPALPQPLPGKINAVRAMPTELEPFGARADLVVFAIDGTLYLRDVAYGRDKGQWSYPLARPSPFTFYVDDESEPEVRQVEDAPDLYAAILGYGR